ncbi:MAG: hypothetical protein FWH43_01950, partial [Endomicrobia bacterium]|nr:hypothetical protein [Endomicrobiia bacterium]
MKTINRFIKELTRLRRICAAAALWLKEMNAVKIISLIVVNCFLLTSVYGQAVASVIDDSRRANQFNQIFDDFSLPHAYGKITGASFAGSDTVVINIQDFHAHPGVQKNISKIIDTFDKRYNIKNVYLEGAYGELDTSWLSAIEDKVLREKVLDSMLQSGRLTGAEYYSALSGRPKVIKGLENKNEYMENLQRFGKILESQDNISLILNSMKEDVNVLRETYYNKDQKKLSALSQQYADGKISERKYFALLYKHTNKLGIDIYKHENIDAYRTLLSREKDLDYKRVSMELGAFISRLKEILPYQTYKAIVDNTGNFTEMDKLYVHIIKISREYNINLEAGFPQLTKFLFYAELGQKINPLELIAEEKRLVGEINEKFSTNISEKEVVFVTGFHKYLEDFLSSKITPEDYKYYEANKKEFRRLWVKYIDNKKMDLLDGYLGLSEAFYTVNIERNGYFFQNIDAIRNVAKLTYEDIGGNGVEKVIKSMESAKNVCAVVTGGFHTDGVSEYFVKNGISFITITPNVAGGVQAADEIYHKMAKEQSKILFQTLAVLNSTQLPDFKKLEMSVQAISDALDRNWNEVNKAVQDVLKNDAEFAGMSVQISEENGNIIFNFTKDNRQINVLYDKTERTAVASMPQESAQTYEAKPKADITSGIKNLFFTVAVFIALSLAASLFAVPIVPDGSFMAAVGSLGVFGGLAYDKSSSDIIAKNSMVESGTERPDFRIFEKIAKNLPADLRMKFITGMLKPGAEITPDQVRQVIDLENEINRLGSRIEKTGRSGSGVGISALGNLQTEKENKEAELSNLIKSLNLEDNISDDTIAAFFGNDYGDIKNNFFDSDNNVKNRIPLEVFIIQKLERAETAGKALRGDKLASFLVKRPLLEKFFISIKKPGVYAGVLSAHIRNRFASLFSASAEETSAEEAAAAPAAAEAQAGRSLDATDDLN